MALILKCEGACGKDMTALEPYTIKDDKYMCRVCGGSEEEKPIIFLNYPTSPTSPTMPAYFFSDPEHLDLYVNLQSHYGWKYTGALEVESFMMDVFEKEFPSSEKFFITVWKNNVAFRKDSPAEPSIQTYGLSNIPIVNL